MTAIDDRSSRIEAFKTVQAILKEMSAKFHTDEASAIQWAAEGLLLAQSMDEPEAVESVTAFNTLLNGEGFQARWQENKPTEDRLRAAFAACGPQPVAVA